VLPLVRAKILSGEIVLTKQEVNKNTFDNYSQKTLNIKERDAKPSSLKNYTATLNKWVRFFKDRDIADIKANEIRDILLSLNIKTSSAKQYLSVLRGVFDEAIFCEVLEINPCNKVKLPKDKIKADVFPFDIDEVSTILDTAGGWFKNFLATGFFTGARTGELFALKWQNIDFKNKKIYIDSTRGQYEEGTTKTGKARFIPLFDNLVPFLIDQQRVTGMKTYVFLTDKGKQPHLPNVRKFMWMPLLKRLKIPYRTLYQTRHTFATTLLNSNKFSMNEVASILGHANIQMLIKHYNKFLKDETDKIDTSLNVFCNSFCDDTSKSA
jgi:integrase